MQARVLILLILAGGIGFGTFHFGRQWLESQQSVPVAGAPAEEAPLRYVLVADRAMSAGQFVRERDLRWQAWPDETLAASYIERGEREISDLSGAVARASLGEGEPITDTRIVLPGDRGFLAAVLSPGMRAVSVPVNETTGIAGLVFPGDRVDVILTHTVRPETGGIGPRALRASETVLQDIRVLAIDQRLEEDGTELKVADTVTLEVTAEQAERINVVLELGSLSLSLRSLAEPEDELVAEAETGDETGDGAAAEAVAGTPPKTALAKPAGPGPFARGPEQTFTLDSDVSMLLAGAAFAQPAPPPAEADEPAPAPVAMSGFEDEEDIMVFRGSSYRTGAN